MPAFEKIQHQLQQSFNRHQFAEHILKPVFAHRFGLLAQPETGEITPGVAKVVAEINRFGEITLDTREVVRCYEVVLQPNVRVEQSRVGIQQVVKRIMHAGDAALVCFVPYDPQERHHWRLTLMVRETTFAPGQDKASIKDLHPRRYTYLVGKGESNRTLTERLVTLGDENVQSQEALIRAFSVERLSKEFFAEYKLHYDRFIADLSESGFKQSVFKGDEKAIRDFVKKMMGRIVFLYFVQKKGWLGASSTAYTDGQPDFIRQLTAGTGPDFYEDRLKPLFFETLNQQRPGDAFRMPDKTERCVPFLNGGLFDAGPLDDSMITFAPERFVSHSPEDPRHRGFLDFLDAFNFTVHEDSPLDHTVAVDPEMLGHIFENLLEDNKDKGAYYTPRAIVHYMCQQSLSAWLNARMAREEANAYKPLGTNQTDMFGNAVRTGQLAMMEPIGQTKAPNPALVEALVFEKETNGLNATDLQRIETLLDAVRICDPAIGSGAFPMGLLQEICALKEVLAAAQHKPWEPAKVKRSVIRNSIYGVDVEQGAVDIARLRFWLSLVVDEEMPIPLPNLDYKIMQGNSLLERFGVIDLTVKDLDNELERTEDQFGKKDIADLRKKVGEYFGAGSPEAKKQLRAAIEQKIYAFIEKRITDRLHRLREELAQNRDLAAQNERGADATPDQRRRKELAALRFERELTLLLKKIAETEQQAITLRGIQHEGVHPYFLWHLWFSEVFAPGKNGFDIVIGNPPYIRHERIKDLKLLLEDHYQVFAGTADILVYFYELGINLLNNNGILSYITSNKFMRAGYGENLRGYLRDKTYIHEIVDFGELPVFAEAATFPVIVTVEKKPVSANGDQKAPPPPRQAPFFAQIKDLKLDDLRAVVRQKGSALQDKAFAPGGWSLASGDYNDLLDQMRAVGTPLGKYAEGKIYRGVLTGLNEAFVIDTATRDRLVAEDPRSAEILKPFVAGDDVRKYEVRTKGKFLIMLPREFTRRSIHHAALEPNKRKDSLWDYDTKKLPRVTREEAETWLKNTYPAVYDWFLPHAEKAAARQDKGEYWWELRACEYYGDFEKAKIMYPEMAMESRFAFSKGELFFNNKAFMINIDHLHLLGILNSSAVWFFLKQICTVLGDADNGGRLELRASYMQTLPIPTANEEELAAISTLVSYILWLGEHSLRYEKTTDVHLRKSYFDQVVNGAVYELYFRQSVAASNKTILAHLTDLPAIAGLSPEQAKPLIDSTFLRLYDDKTCPIRYHLFTLDSVPEIAKIRQSYKTSND